MIDGRINNGGARKNAGRKIQGIEEHRTALFGKAWKFLNEEFENGDKRIKRDIIKLIMSAMARTIPQENINKNETVVSFSETEQELLKDVIEIFRNKLKQNE